MFIFSMLAISFSKFVYRAYLFVIQCGSCLFQIQVTINNKFIRVKDKMNFGNPEDIARTIMNKSFLKSRQNLRENTGSEFFHDNRIRSCSYVKECKGGLKAVPYYDKRDNKIYPTPTDVALRRSWTSSVHSNRGQEHAGGHRDKSLTAYNPSAQRNLMGIPDFKPPYPNSSHIEIGARSKRDTKHYITNYRNDMIFQKKHLQTNHPGIQAFKNKWLRSRLQK